MAKKQTSAEVTWLQTSLLRLCHAHFWLVGIIGGVIIVSDAWNLITRELVWQRWLLTGVMLVITTCVWYICRARIQKVAYYRTLVLLLVLMDIVFATYFVYSERGMASRGVMLYMLPLAVSAALISRTALFGTAALCTAAYTMACTKYFYDYFNEGYKVELYATLIMYGAIFFVMAAILWVVVRARFDR